mmetsp:Transcript_130433/g.226658  ORF Transcript_130433/g.226658 Transcript_130433/m.226658 type:complete len:104 (-) Transcript_130433:1552-1863(-)
MTKTSAATCEPIVAATLASQASLTKLMHKTFFASIQRVPSKMRKPAVRKKDCALCTSALQISCCVQMQVFCDAKIQLAKERISTSVVQKRGSVLRCLALLATN